jgi:hypothetical protein
MSRWRVGILDLVAVGVTAAAVLLPSQTKAVNPLYEGDVAARQLAIAEAQADLARDPKDRTALTRLTEALTDVGQSDWALRVAGAAAAQPGADRWRALLVVSAAHADRLDVPEAYDWAKKALAACDAPGAACADHERTRIDLYVKALKAGIDSGIDPRLDPEGFAHAVNSATPMIRVGGRKHAPPK